MGRLLVLLIALGLPFAAYFAYLKLARRKQALEAAGQLPAWQALPWTWLIIASVLLLVATLLLLRFTNIDPDAWIGGESLIGR
ncbi:MAG TPA: hypothetical protein VJL84_04230 [Kiloniellales bacterium]|nr:hypothetical protein [Kiloniellales bacterium]